MASRWASGYGTPARFSQLRTVLRPTSRLWQSPHRKRRLAAAAPQAAEAPRIPRTVQTGLRAPAYRLELLSGCPRRHLQQELADEAVRAIFVGFEVPRPRRLPFGQRSEADVAMAMAATDLGGMLQLSGLCSRFQKRIVGVVQGFTSESTV